MWLYLKEVLLQWTLWKIQCLPLTLTHPHTRCHLVHETAVTNPMKFPVREQGDEQEWISTAVYKSGFQPVFNNLNPSSWCGKGDWQKATELLKWKYFTVKMDQSLLSELTRPPCPHPLTSMAQPSCMCTEVGSSGTGCHDDPNSCQLSAGRAITWLPRL